MKKILFIAPSSIPINGPESICNYKIIKCLSSLNYHLDIISKDVFNSEYPPISDTEDLNVNVQIIRVSNKFNISTIYTHFMCFIKTGYIYKGSHWAFPAIAAGEKLIENTNYDYIFTRSSPSEIVGVYLAKKYNLKLITNFNDPFPIESYPIPYGQGFSAKLSVFNKRLIRDIIKYSSFISFANERLRNYTLKYFKGLDIQNTLITPHIVENYSTNYNKLEKNDTLKILYAGNICEPRNPHNFFVALKKIVDTGYKKICVDFMGLQDDSFLEYVSDFSLSSNVKVIPSMNYFDTLKLMKTYDIALIIEAQLEEGIFLPTKVVDYLQCGIPIATCSPSIGVLNDLFCDKIIDYFSSIDDSVSIYYMLENIINDYQKGLIFNLKEKDISNMTMESLTDIFDTVL